MPFFFWELAVGLWMLFKGFNRTAPIVAHAIATAARTDSRIATAPVAASIAAKAGVA
jgi:hypothetical protein